MTKAEWNLGDYWLGAIQHRTQNFFTIGWETGPRAMQECIQHFLFLRYTPHFEKSFRIEWKNILENVITFYVHSSSLSLMWLKFKLVWISNLA